MGNMKVNSRSVTREESLGATVASEGKELSRVYKRTRVTAANKEFQPPVGTRIRTHIGVIVEECSSDSSARIHELDGEELPLSFRVRVVLHLLLVHHAAIMDIHTGKAAFAIVRVGRCGRVKMRHLTARAST